MRSRAALDSLRSSFLDLYAAARDQGEHEIAYHALMAAEHAAHRLGDMDALQAIEQRAREHGKHRMSSLSASSRFEKQKGRFAPLGTSSRALV